MSAKVKAILYGYHLMFIGLYLFIIYNSALKNEIKNSNS